jgi:hypothetical protein
MDAARGRLPPEGWRFTGQSCGWDRCGGIASRPVDRDEVSAVPASFHLISTWRVPLDEEEVFALLANPRHYGDWWGRGAMRCVFADPGAPAVGKRACLSVRGFLPYRLTMTLTATALERPSRIVGVSRGDLVGVGAWTISNDGLGSVAELDWRVAVRGRLERAGGLLARPLLAANHRWTMRRGEEGMASRGRDAIAEHRLLPPGPAPDESGAPPRS